MYKQFIGLKGSDIIYKKLYEYGVKTIYMYNGSAVMPLVDKFNYSKNTNVKYKVHTNKQMCKYSSIEYAKSSGKMGVSIVTNEPELNNMITPMLDATYNDTPLMVISGLLSQNVKEKTAFQKYPAVCITKPVTKFSYCINSVEEIPKIMDIAYYFANNNKKGSVHIDLPKCVADNTFKGFLYK